MTDCTRDCPPDCLSEKLEMARRIEELEKALQLAKDMILANDLDLPNTMTVINDALGAAHPNQSIGEQK